MTIKSRIENMLPKKLRDILRLWYRTFIKGQPAILEKPSGLTIGYFSGFEMAYRTNTADERVIKQSFENDIIFSGVPEYQPDGDHIIIDVGAHIGTFSIFAASKTKQGRVYAIEASQDSFNFLKINVALNKCNNVSIHHLALADKDGSIALYHDQGSWGHSTVKRLSLSSETVNSCTLSSFLEENGINECHFMKLNCEGSEFPILLNTPNDVLRKFGIILVMYHCDLWENNTEDDLVSHLMSSGFKCVFRNRDPKRGWIIAENLTKLHV